MKAALVLEQFVDVDSVPAYQQKDIQFRPDKKGKPEAFFAVGTVYEGNHAIRICQTGQGKPLDEECARAVGMSLDQLESAQVEYKMNALGINRKEDRELFKAGVILGYDDKLNYIHGPNWDKYQAAKADAIDEDI